MSQPDSRYLLLTVMTAATLCAGCASMVRECDQLAACLDNYSIVSAERERPRMSVAHQRRAPSPVKLAQHEAMQPSPAEAAPGPEALAAPPAVPELADGVDLPRLSEGPALIDGAPLATPAGSVAAGRTGATNQPHASAAAMSCGCAVGAACPHCPLEGLLCGECSLGGRSLAGCKLLQPPPPGPPPVRYVPEMPPQFLPVPTGPVVPQGRSGPVELPRGNVERGFEPELTVMGYD
ncbi:MAG: hypothetical protein KDA44_20300 [Planctomycetales bacterium]|nr:hypothetical protein [Planctomycetales bacterium]